MLQRIISAAILLGNCDKTHENRPYISDGGNLDFWKKKQPKTKHLQQLHLIFIRIVGWADTHGRCYAVPTFLRQGLPMTLSGVKVVGVQRGSLVTITDKRFRSSIWLFFFLCSCTSRLLPLQSLLSTSRSSFPHLFPCVKWIKWFMWLEQLYQEGLFVKLFLFLNWRAY